MLRMLLVTTALSILFSGAVHASRARGCLWGAAAGIATLSADARSEITPAGVDVSLYKPGVERRQSPPAQGATSSRRSLRTAFQTFAAMSRTRATMEYHLDGAPWVTDCLTRSRIREGGHHRGRSFDTPTSDLSPEDRIADPDNIIQIHRIDSTVMRQHYDLYREQHYDLYLELMHRAGPSTRR